MGDDPMSLGLAWRCLLAIYNINIYIYISNIVYIYIVVVLQVSPGEDKNTLPSLAFGSSVTMPHGGLEEPKDGWTRYFDPGAARTYLYCHQTGEWYFDPPESAKQSKSSELALNSAPQEPINASEQAGQVPIFGVSLQERPPAPALPAASTRAASMSADTGRDGAIQDLAKIDPIVQDLLRDELKLKKKLREIEALEVASQSKQLEAMQLTKLSKKESMLADLQTVQAHLAEALEDFKSRRIRNQASDGFDGSRGVGAAPKLKAKQTQNVQRLNPASTAW